MSDETTEPTPYDVLVALGLPEADRLAVLRATDFNNAQKAAAGRPALANWDRRESFERALATYQEKK